MPSVPRPRRPSIRIALLGLILVAIVPYLAIIGYQTANRHEADLSAARDSVHRIARQTAAETSRFIAESRDVLERMADRALVQAVDAARCDPILGDYHRLNARFANIGVVNAAGNVICSSVEQPDGGQASVAATGWFRSAVTTGSFIVGEPFTGPITKRWVSVLAQPIRRDGRVVGVLAAPIDLVKYGALLSDSETPVDAIVSMVDENGVVIARSTAPDTFVGTSIRETEIGRFVLAGQTEIARAVGADGVDRFYAIAAVAGTGWRAYAGLSAREVLGPAEATNLTTLLLAVVGTLVVAWLGQLVGRRIADPIESLGFAARRLGDDSPAPTPRGPVEIHEAIMGFNEMAARRVVIEQELAAQTDAAMDARRTLEDILAAAPLAVMLCDQDGTVRYWGGAAEAMFGWTAEDAIGRIVPEAPPSQAAEAEDRRARIRAGAIVHDEVVVRHTRSGEPITVAIHAAPRRDPAGEVIGIVAIALDIRERLASEDTRVDLEARLAQSQKLDAVGQLAGGIAHDFNNLLTAIGGYSDLLAASPDLPETERADVEEIRNAVTRATALTSQLLAFSRGKHRDPEPLDLGAVIREIEPLLRRLIGEHIELRTSLPDDVWTVVADTSQIEQVIVNLVVNARDAMPEGGRLSLELVNRMSGRGGPEAEDRRPGDAVILSVRDTGSGMDERVRSHLFEPFFTTKGVGKGTGLGLATVYGIVEQSGGEISVDTKPGAGTTFTISLPRAGAAPLVRLARVPATTEAAALAGTVLLVEDDVLVRRLLRRVLTAAGFTVIEAADGEEAAQILVRDDGSIDIAVTDLVMPVLGGRGFAERARAHRPDLPIVFMSGYTEEDVQDLAGRRGSAFLVKPLAPVDLLREIRRLLEERLAA